MMDTILISQLSRDEGRRLVAYQDTNGWWTIGVGHLLGGSARMHLITEEECNALLGMDIEIAVQALARVFDSRLTLLDGPRLRALVNMMFNRGEDAVAKSTTITPAIKAAIAGTGSWEQVANAIVDSPWGKQIGDRANRLARQFTTGVDQ